MDWIFKAVSTALAVLIVMAVARRGGHRLAGVVAALPTITAPTLAWLAYEQGTAFAVSAAVGSVAACAMLAVFALGYARASRSGGVAIALGCGLVGALAMALPAMEASAHLGDALVLALGCCALAFALMPAQPLSPASAQRRPRVSAGATAPIRTALVPTPLFPTPLIPTPPVPTPASEPMSELDGEIPPRPRSYRELAWVAAVAGALTALAALLGPALGGFATGLLASLPLITGAVAMVEHAGSGHLAATQFLRGYVWGLFGKAAFGAIFALLAARIGTAPALAGACVCACMLSAIPPRPFAMPYATRSRRAWRR